MSGDADTHRRRRTFAWTASRTVRRIAAAGTVLLALGGAATVAVGHQIKLEEASQDAQWDPVAHPSIRWIGRTHPISRNVAYGDVHAVDVVMLDRRVSMSGIVHRALKLFDVDRDIVFSGASDPAVRKAAEDNPILKWRMHANCRTGRWRIAAIMVAESFDGPPIASEYTPGRASWGTMSDGTRRVVCDPPADADSGFEAIPSRAAIALQSMPAGDPAGRATTDDGVWYGQDITHPPLAPRPSPSFATRLMQRVGLSAHQESLQIEARPPSGWTKASQYPGIGAGAGSGPTMSYELTTHTPAAAAAALRNVAAQLAARFRLGPSATPLEHTDGELFMRIDFSTTPRNDRPTSPVIETINLNQNSNTVILSIVMTPRQSGVVDAWRREQDHGR